VVKEGSVTTSAFTDTVIANLGKRPERWRAREHKQLRIQPLEARRDWVRPTSRVWVGADVFVESPASPDELGASLDALVEGTPFRLKMISNRGTKVYPSNGGMTDCVDHWRCRFVRRDATTPIDDAALLALLGKVGASHRWMHVEKLEEHDGALAYTRAQGED
jgi:isocitrate dehydrogenase